MVEKTDEIDVEITMERLEDKDPDIPALESAPLTPGMSGGTTRIPPDTIPLPTVPTAFPLRDKF